ncbi:hypothetical protein Tsubulata_020395 [Turnera subulata]|uniref:NB-ARC domain-containing protein n=1 Tax=Turnera subulata TaxID=218843 RepID=A0A9Q0FIC4_9ROSI|nr:hypothetical protein Tsubulata_020395 [Turnera subulata]
MEVVGEAVLSAVLQPLFQNLKSSDLLRFARRNQVVNELKKWESRLLEIYAVLRVQITNTKFLIVLDDVWNENHGKWTMLSTPFLKGASGSKTIVTTRNKSVSTLMGSVHTYQLEELSQDDCLSLFQWEAVLNSRIWELPETKSDILPALRMSYQYIPSCLKQCLALCAIFPKDYEFDEDELIYLWMGEGFLELAEHQDLMEELDHAYFHELIMDKARSVMHDLIHDLAQYVIEEKFLNLDNDLNGAKSFVKARHLSFTPRECDTLERFEAFLDINKLQTFLVFPFVSLCVNCLSSKVLHDLVPKLKLLRVLSLAGYSIEELSGSIGTLVHLRIIKLPESLNTSNLEVMPAQIGDLKNLRTLPKFVVVRGKQPGMFQLRNFAQLQAQLHITRLHNVVNIRDAEHANIKGKHGLNELTLAWTDDFNGLRWKTRTNRSYGGSSFPEWVGDPSFTNMVQLRLEDCLKSTSLPPLGKLPSLKCLSIKGMNEVKEVGVEFCGSDDFPSLESLKIEDKDQPNFGNLREFEVHNCPKFVGNLFYCTYLISLTKLDIYSCPKLASLPGMLPSLRELNIGRCQHVLLNNVSNLTSLTSLRIWRIERLVSLNDAYVQDLVALEDLVIRDCSELVYFLNTVKLRHANSLCMSLVEGGGNLPLTIEALTLRNCSKLVSFPRKGSVCALLSVFVCGCASLKSFPKGKLPATLKSLGITGCNLKCLPLGIVYDSAHKVLIGDFLAMPFPAAGDNHFCKLVCFPDKGFPPRLTSLVIRNCKKLAQPMEEWRLHRLTSLEHLSIDCFNLCTQSIVSFPDEEGLLPSLTTLHIGGFENLIQFKGSPEPHISSSFADLALP